LEIGTRPPSSVAAKKLELSKQNKTIGVPAGRLPSNHLISTPFLHKSIFSSENL
jgi:hypothetical protein